MARNRKVSVAKSQELRPAGATEVDPKRITECLGGFSLDNLFIVADAVQRLIRRTINARATELGVSKSDLAAMRKRGRAEAKKAADEWAKFDDVEFVFVPQKPVSKKHTRQAAA